MVMSFFRLNKSSPLSLWIFSVFTWLYLPEDMFQPCYPDICHKLSKPGKNRDQPIVLGVDRSQKSGFHLRSQF
jgi:hypothetical protein